MFGGLKFANKLQSLSKTERKNFSIFRNMRSSMTKNVTDEEAIVVFNLLRRKSVKRVLFALGGAYLAAFSYYGLFCIWEDNLSAKKYTRFRTLDYILAGGSLFTISAFAGANFVFNKNNPGAQVSTSKIPIHLRFIPIFLVLGFGLLLHENNILVTLESFVGLGASAYMINNVRLVLNAKQKRPIIAPLLGFGVTLCFLYSLKTYFTFRQRRNFKNFLNDFNSRKEHI